MRIQLVVRTTTAILNETCIPIYFLDPRQCVQWLMRPANNELITKIHSIRQMTSKEAINYHERIDVNGEIIEIH